MKMLLTGAAGFIGQHVISELLSREHHVVALLRSATPRVAAKTDNLEVLLADLRQPQLPDLAAKGIDAVIHLAAATSGPPATQFADTVGATVNLLSAARQAGIRRLVGISSIAVLDYRALRPMTVIDEHAPTADEAGTGIYATAKIRQERLFQDFARESTDSCIVVRPGLAYDEHRLTAAYAGIIKGRIRLLASHPGEIPTIEVRGLAAAIANAAERQVRGCEVIHLVDDHLPKQSQYLEGLRRRGLLPNSGIVVPWRALQGMSGLARLASGAVRFPAGAVPEILLSRGFAARLKPFRYSNAKAKKLLDWSPTREFA